MIHITTLGATLLAVGTITAPAAAVPTAAAGYVLTTFAGPLAGSSAPDSIAVVGGNVFVGYGNGGDPTRASGAMSTIAEYSKHGALLCTVTVAGHNDGLRYDTATGKLWSIQNEDSALTLVQIDPKTLAATTPIGFSDTAHGGNQQAGFCSDFMGSFFDAYPHLPNNRGSPSIDLDQLID